MSVALTFVVRTPHTLFGPDAMYPDPHIPSAPNERSVPEDCRPSHLPRRIRFLIGSSAALFVLVAIALSISVMQQAHLQAQREQASGNDESIAISDYPIELRFSTRSHPTRMP